MVEKEIPLGDIQEFEQVVHDDEQVRKLSSLPPEIVLTFVGRNLQWRGSIDHQHHGQGKSTYESQIEQGLPGKARSLDAIRLPLTIQDHFDSPANG
jgi:hypothetical protein